MQELISIQRSTKKLHMFMSMDMALDSGRQAVDDLVKIVRETLADSEQFLELNPRDLNNEPDRRNLLEQAKRTQTGARREWLGCTSYHNT
jgi:hypothetical protein